MCKMLVIKMDTTKFALSEPKFRNYVASIEFDKIDKAWFVSWTTIYPSYKTYPEKILPLIRLSHYNGFLFGALDVAEGRLK
jgi:hypothetical protein